MNRERRTLNLILATQRKLMKRLTLMVLLLVAAFSTLVQVAAFTYQGRLDVDGSPAEGLYDFRCQLYNAAAPPDALVSSTVTNLAVVVSRGVFSLTLGFGEEVFNGQERWLSISVRTNNPALPFTVLSPRQRLAWSPYTVYALKAAGFQEGSNPTFTGTAAFTPPSGAPFTVGNATKVVTLNADLLDGMDSTAFVRKAGDTMTGKLTVNGPGGKVVLSDTGSFFGNDIAVSGQASSVLGVGVVAGSSGANGMGLSASATGLDGVAVHGDASNGSDARGISGRSTTGLAGYFDGAVQVRYNSPFNKPQLQITEPADNGFARLRMHTGSRAFWDVAVGTGVNATNTMRFYNSTQGDVMTLSETGNLFVRVLTITGGADIAEPFQMSEPELPKGAVVVIDEENAGHLKLSTRAYDRQVAGVISGAGGVNTGLSLSQHGVMEGGQPVALTGRVYVQADATSGAIRPGDLLTTSDTPGHAMRVSDPARAPGAVLGKAMTGLPEGTGLVLVLVTLQ
jgi:hypothetical protein